MSPWAVLPATAARPLFTDTLWPKNGMFEVPSRTGALGLATFIVDSPYLSEATYATPLMTWASMAPPMPGRKPANLGLGEEPELTPWKILSQRFKSTELTDPSPLR